MFSCSFTALVIITIIVVVVVAAVIVAIVVVIVIVVFIACVVLLFLFLLLFTPCLVVTNPIQCFRFLGPPPETIKLQLQPESNPQLTRQKQSWNRGRNIDVVMPKRKFIFQDFYDVTNPH